MEQFAANLRQLRNAAGITGEELGQRAAMSRQEPLQHEGNAAREPTVTRALRLAHSLEASIDLLASRIYWNPGEVACKPSERRPPSQRLSGFFLVPPEGESVFDPAPLREPVVNRHEAAAIFGQNVRSARERRHLTQTKLARAVGLGKDGLSLIERGIRETTIEKLLALARALEVTPEFLLGGVAWQPKLVPCVPLGPGGARRHPARSLDAPIRDLWRQERTAREIADAVGTSHGGVSAIVHRLREHGEELPYRNLPTRAVHEGARRRRSSLPPLRRREAEEAVEQTADADRREAASKDDVAARIGANVAFHRRQAGLSQEQLSEAIETERSYVSQIERGTFVPRIGLVVKLAASLNIRCERVTSGIIWEPSMGAFYVEATEDESGTPSKRLGHNALRARQRIGFSQQALSARASMSRGDVVDFEHGNRNFRIFAAVRLAGALEVDLPELFSGVVDWNVRPLPPPEYEPGTRPTKAERDAMLARLWREGRPEQEVAEALDLEVASVGPYVRELRDAGVDLPYRRPPRSAVERAARRRRGGRCEHERGGGKPYADGDASTPILNRSRR